MDKCKYYLTDKGVTLTFNSDAELTDYIRSTLNTIEIVSETYDKPWKDNPLKINKATSYALKEKVNERFELVKDLEEGYYSIHFKTSNKGSLTSEEKQLLINKIASELKIGDKLSTYGDITKGAISGINRFLEEGFEKTSEIRQVTMDGKKFSIPILIKTSDTISKTVIKYSKVDSGQLTKAEQVLKHINQNNPLVDFNSSTFFSAYDFLKEKYDISGNGVEEYLSPDLNEENYIEKESLRLIKDNPEFKAKADIDKDAAIKEAKIFLKEELKIDKRMEDVSIAASKVIRNIISDGNGIITLKTVEPLLRAIAKYNDYEYTPGLYKKEQQDNIINIFKKWYEQNIQDSGYIYKAGLMLSKQQPIKSKSGVSSFLTYLAIDKNGIPNLVNVKVSRNYFNNWHSAKKLNAYYHLGLNKQILDGMLPDDINTDISLLQVLPIITPLDENGKINIDSVIISNPQEQQNRELSTKIQQNLQKLLPNPIKANTEESLKLIEKNSIILKSMFGKYEFRTKLLKANAEKEAQKRIDIATANKSTKLKFYDTLSRKDIEEPNTPQGRENFKERILKYFEKYNENQHSATLEVMKQVRDKKYQSEEFKRIFERYNSPNWELISNRPELVNSGILLFRNNLTLTIEAVGLTINQLDQVNKLGFGTTIVGKFDKDSIKKSDSNVWDASNAHIEGIKVMTVLNSIPDIIKKYTINKILIYDIGSNQADWINTDSAIHNFGILVNRINKDLDIKNNFSGYSPVLKMTPKITSLKSELLEALNSFKFTNENEELRSTILNTKIEDLSNNKLRLDWFLKLRDHLYKIHPELTKIRKDKISDFSNPVMMLNLFISIGISYYSGINSDFDFDVPQYGIRIGDFTHILKTWVTGQAPKYDSQGNKLVGLLQGQLFNTTDALPSNYMTRLHDLISLAQNKITSDYNKIKNIVTKTTREMYEELGRSDLERLVIGNAEKFHEVFFEKDGTKISTDFKLKNPWSDSSELDPLQRKYLKRYVYFLYLYSKNSNTDLDTFEKFEKSEELKTMLSDETINKVLTVPLVRKQSLGRLKTITSEGLWKYLGNTWDSMLNQLDIRDMTGEENELEQKIGAFNSINGFGKMYNRFDSQESKEFRDYLINNKGVNEFEVNLDTLVLKYAFENLRESYFNEVLPKLDASLEVMKFYGWQSGKSEETEKALENFFDQIKISIFNVSPVKGKENEQFFSLVRSAQKATSVMVLALRPVTAIKELIVGTIKNTSYAWSKIYGDDSFDGKDLAEAYQLLTTSKEDFSLIWELNDEYRIANRDMNQIVDKTKVDRHGLNFFSNLMYWSNTAPDYVNRMALFLAKMIKDGVYSAHSLQDGNLVYDVTKDERYSYYLSKRKTYGLKFTGTDNKYDTQRSLYLTKIKAFNENIISKNEKVLTEEDLLPSAYTQEEKESIKTFTELAYGYYDHERSPLIKHLPMGIMFGQFMTFWPAKVKYYFGGVDVNSKRGKFAQKYREENGKKIYYFVKFESDENGEEYRYEVPESELSANDPRIPAYGWIGDPHEGLMYSLGLTVRALLHPEESISDLSDTTIRNSKLMIHDLLVAMMAMLLGILLFSEKTGEFDSKKTTNWRELSQYEKLATKIMLRSTNEFNPFKTFTDLNSTPAFITNMRETAQDFKKLFEGDQDVMRFFSNTFNFLEVIPNPSLRN